MFPVEAFFRITSFSFLIMLLAPGIFRLNPRIKPNWLLNIIIYNEVLMGAESCPAAKVVSYLLMYGQVSFDSSPA